jgi:DNA repair protein RadC
MRLETRDWIHHIDAAEAPAAEPTAPEDLALIAECLRPQIGGSAQAAATGLIARFGSLSGVFGASADGLADAPGMTVEAAEALGRLQALAVRLAGAEIAPRAIISSWTALLSYVRVALRHERREQFRILFLDVRNRLVRDEVLGVGTVDHAPVYPREVIRRALELSASSLILVHNHPGGDPTPSRADIEITKQIVEAGRLLKIAVHDHLVVGCDGVASFKSLGLL